LKWSGGVALSVVVQSGWSLTSRCRRCRRRMFKSLGNTRWLHTIHWGDPHELLLADPAGHPEVDQVGRPWCQLNHHEPAPAARPAQSPASLLL
jgi:hypothetical protein